jgi:hypothetical protein
MLKFNDGHQHFQCLVRMLKVFLCVCPKHEYVKSIICQILTLLHWEAEKDVLPFWDLFWKHASVFGEESIELSFSLLGRSLKNDGMKNVLEHVAKKYRAVRSYLDLKAELGDDYYGKNTMKSVSGRSEVKVGSVNVSMVKAWMLTMINQCRRNTYRPYKDKTCFGDAAAGSKNAWKTTDRPLVCRVFRQNVCQVFDLERERVTNFSVSNWLNTTEGHEEMRLALATDEKQDDAADRNERMVEEERDEFDDFEMGSAPEDEVEEPVRLRAPRQPQPQQVEVASRKGRKRKKVQDTYLDASSDDEAASSNRSRQDRGTKDRRQDLVDVLAHNNHSARSQDYTNRVAQKDGSADKKAWMEKMKETWFKANPNKDMPDSVYYSIEEKAVAATCQQATGRRTRGAMHVDYTEAVYTNLQGQEKHAMSRAVHMSARDVMKKID